MYKIIKPYTINEIHKKIKAYEEFIYNLKLMENKITEVCQLKPKDFDELIAQKYIELQSTVEVANYLNNNDYIVSTESKIGKRKFKSTDITSLIENKRKDSYIFSLASAFMRYNIQKKDLKPLLKLIKNDLN